MELMEAKISSNLPYTKFIRYLNLMLPQFLDVFYICLKCNIFCNFVVKARHGRTGSYFFD